MKNHLDIVFFNEHFYKFMTMSCYIYAKYNKNTTYNFCIVIGSFNVKYAEIIPITGNRFKNIAELLAPTF